MSTELLKFGWFVRLSGAIEAVYPSIRTIVGSSTDPEVVADGRRMLLFCSPNYLGLSNDPRVRGAFKDAVDRYGVGTNGSGVVSGYTDAHRRLEDKVAQLMGEESAIFFNSVSDATADVVTSVVRPPLLSLSSDGTAGDLGDVAVFCDLQSHASVLDAVKLARPDKTYFYRHCDAEHLQESLKRSKHRRRVIVTDGYFSMSAQLAPLPRIAELADEYDALVVVDDAHANGVIGDHGRGTLEYFGVERRSRFITVLSAAKALGVRGGFVAGTRAFVRYLRVSGRRYLFSGTLPAAIPVAVLAALEIAEDEPWRREGVLERAEYLRKELKSMGQTVLGEKHIVPWLVQKEERAVAVSAQLYELGIFAPDIRYPAVPKGEAVIRFMPMATHTKEHLDRLLDACQYAANASY